jgi:hypothetical protein
LSARTYSVEASPGSEDPAPAPRTKKERRVLGGVIIFVLVGVFISLLEPHLFRHIVVRGVLQMIAWRAGVELHIDRVEGTLFAPVAVVNSHFRYRGASGTVVRGEASRIQGTFNWANIFRPDGHRWLRRLVVQDATVKIVLPSEGVARASAKKQRHSWWRQWVSEPRTLLPVPSRIEAHEMTLVVQSNGDYLRIDDGNFDASTFDAGTIRAGRITLKQPWLRRTFHDVRGTTALQDTRLIIGNVALEPGVDCRTLSLHLDELRAGQLDMELQLAAFGGRVRCQAQTLPRSDGFVLDATGEFSRIDIAKFVGFIDGSEAAGGVIQEGRFSFRGSPRHAANATGSLRFEATNFQWESRQWDSLIVGATLMEGRIQLPEFELRQGSNRLSLSGELALPKRGMKWWENDARCEIAANIEDITSLSALLLPEYRYAAGKISIDGSIRAKEKQFHGQLIVSGSSLKWRDAPIENLHAAVKLTGNECRLTSIQLFNRGDYLRGRGVVNILGPTQYWGELRASVDELATYAALLQKPILPEPLAGGAVIEWSGEGSAKGHSGEFSAQLNRVRPVGALAAYLHPINIDFDAQYGPGLLHFSKFSLADEDSAFTAKVVVDEKSLSMRELRLVHREKVRLEGDAVLPLDLWKAWPNTSLDALLTEKSSSNINLTASDLDLADASLLSGWIFPVAGTVRGNLLVNGPIDDLRFGGEMTVRGGRFPIGDCSTGILSDVEAGISGAGDKLKIDSLTARHLLGAFAANGTIELKALRRPRVDLHVSSEEIMLPLAWASPAESGRVISSVALGIAGDITGGSIRGDATIKEIERNSPINLTALWSDPISARLNTASGERAGTRAPSGWQWDVTLRTNPQSPARIRPLGGSVTADLHLIGGIEAPAIEGTVTVAGTRAVVHAVGLDVDQLTFSRANGNDGDTVPGMNIDLVARGELSGEAFALFASGPLQHPLRLVVAPPPLTEEAVWHALEGREAIASESSSRFSLRANAPLGAAADVFEWREIPTPPAVETGNVTVTGPASGFDGYIQ